MWDYPYGGFCQMNGKIRNTCVALLLSAAVLTPLSAVTMHKSASYSSGKYNVDGGVMEIIAYNSTNNHAYSVNGQSGVLAALDLSVLGGNGSCVILSGLKLIKITPSLSVIV